MSAAASPDLAFSRFGLREAIAWGAAAAVVLAAHLAIGYGAQHLRPPDPTGGDTPVLTVELAPMAMAPADEVLPEPVEPVDEPEEIVQADEPEQAIEPAEVVEAEPVETPQEQLDEVVPDIVEAVAPDVAIPLPEPVPVKKKAAAKKKVEKPAPKPVKKTVEKPAPKKEKTASKQASATAAAKPAPRGAAGAAKQRVSPASWLAKVHARLRRHQRYPSGAKSRREEGNVRVSFTIDASGRVKSSRISRSSGNAELDRAALDMVRRASPVPAPPPGANMSITVPVVFNLR